MLIVPDKDADGLSAGVIIHRTLIALGLPFSLIEAHLVEKGSNVHNDAEKLSMEAKKPRYMIVVDQGSRAGPPIIDAPNTKCLIIDHHLSDEFPENSVVEVPPGGAQQNFLADSFKVVSACHYPPVATSALLTYEICKPLHPTIESSCGYLCIIGTHGDLGTSLKWKSPFPDMIDVFKSHTKKALNDAVSLLNAREQLRSSFTLT